MTGFFFRKIIRGICLAGLAAGATSACEFHLPSLEAVVTLTPAPTETATLSPTPEITVTLPIAAPTETATLSPTPSRTPTRLPSATSTETLRPGVYPTRTATFTRTPTATRTVTPTPTITNTPTPYQQVQRIRQPGLLSRLTSPIQAEINALVGEDGMVRIELIGEDGRMISAQHLDYRQFAGRRFLLVPKISFEIPAVAETARFQVSAVDLQGRLMGLSSVDVVLLSVGRTDLTPPDVVQEPYLIRAPEENGVVSGGVLRLEGLARPVNDSPLWIELITENNVVMSTKQLVVDPPTGDLSHTPFTVEIPYQVSEPTRVRLTIRQEGGRIPGTVALNSILVTLEP